jgi:predicted aminopeptidase
MGVVQGEHRAAQRRARSGSPCCEERSAAELRNSAAKRSGAALESPAVPAVPAWLVLAAALLSAGCFTTRYVAQAAYGQLELSGYARSVDDVLADPRTPERTALLLEESREILRFARAAGLDDQGNYRRYVDLRRGQVVWFVTASRPLAFEPKVWRFPVAGSFPYLGWFEEDEARRFVAKLEAQGWDVSMRRVRAYSTGGWFKDPIVSTMFTSGDDAILELAALMLHELVHANVLVKDQAVFNESVATFVGDALAADYLVARFGDGSPQVLTYHAELAKERARGARMARAYAELDALYRGPASDAEKRAGKERVTSALEEELELPRRPNNADLQQFRTYHAGQDAFAALFAACGRSWPRFLSVVKSTPRSLFPQRHARELDGAIRSLAARCARPA